MKIDAFICVIVLALTLVIPSLAYFNTADSWASFSAETLATASRTEEMAKQTELGKIKPDVAGFPTYLRMQAASQRTIAEIFAQLNSASRKLMSATIGAVQLQGLLLFWLLWRKRKALRVKQL